MTVFHIPTVYLIIGLLYALLPMVVWLVLATQKSSTVQLWCVGGESLALGLLLIGLRAHLPSWVTYTLANVLCWTGILLQALALRRALDEDWRMTWVVSPMVVWLGVFEYFRLGLQRADLRFMWASLFFVAVFSYISYLALRVSKMYALRSGRWLSAVYALTAFTILIRLARVGLGLTEPDAVAQGIDSVLTVVAGLLISVIGSFTFVAMFLERSTKREIQATEQRVRQEESTRLGEQIAHLERQRTLGMMSSSFAHELSQPLTAILMDAQAIKTSLQSGTNQVDEILESVQEIENSTYRTVKLVERIRNFIRPTQSAYEVFDMRALLRDVAELLAYDLRTRQIQLKLEVDETPCWVHGDRIQLSQIVLNVYRNAFEAMANNTQKIMWVTLERIEERIVLRVHDSGTGIAEDVKEFVGQPFVTTKAEGLGVGLSISKAIAEMHSGSLSISNAVEGGAIVELNLPATSSFVHATGRAL